jgi:hypothetical protein
VSRDRRRLETQGWALEHLSAQRKVITRRTVLQRRVCLTVSSLCFSGGCTRLHNSVLSISSKLQIKMRGILRRTGETKPTQNASPRVCCTNNKPQCFARFSRKIRVLVHHLDEASICACSLRVASVEWLTDVLCNLTIAWVRLRHSGSDISPRKDS